jgi:glutathionylspermidine synthase
MKYADAPPSGAALAGGAGASLETVRLPPADAGITTRPWGISAAEQARVLRTMRFRNFKWDTWASGTCLVLPEALVLSRAVHEHVVRTVEQLNGALGRFEARVRGDAEALRRLAIPPELFPLIRDEEERTLQIARYDLFPTEDGRWLVSEFNEDVPGGFNEAELPPLLGDPGPGLSWEGDLRQHFVDAFEPYDHVALLYATGFADDLQHVLILERWLQEAGHRTVLGSPVHLERRWLRPHVLGTRVAAAFRFYPAEWMPALENLGTWLRLGVRLPMMNPVHRLVRQSKTIFALWAEDRYCDARDRALVAAHCPRTADFEPAQLPMLRQERERWVLKRAFGRMADGVVIGALSTDRQWGDALTDAARAPAGHCIQEYFRVRPLQFGVGPLYPAIGAYVVNGRFAGYYSRAAARPLITHEAFHVATLVQDA